MWRLVDLDAKVNHFTQAITGVMSPCAHTGIVFRFSSVPNVFYSRVLCLSLVMKGCQSRRKFAHLLNLFTGKIFGIRLCGVRRRVHNLLGDLTMLFCPKWLVNKSLLTCPSDSTIYSTSSHLHMLRGVLLRLAALQSPHSSGEAFNEIRLTMSLGSVCNTSTTGCLVVDDWFKMSEQNTARLN